MNSLSRDRYVRCCFVIAAASFALSYGCNRGEADLGPRDPAEGESGVPSGDGADDAPVPVNDASPPQNDALPPQIDASPPPDVQPPRLCTGDSGSPRTAGQASDATGDETACSRETVWPTGSASFTLFMKPNGFVNIPPPDAGCRPLQMTYQYSAQTKTLWARGCRGFRPVDQLLSLTDAEVDEIEAAVRSTLTTCRTVCSLDTGTEELTIYDEACSPKMFVSNTYSGCGNPLPPPPWVELTDLWALSSVLSSLTALCDTEAGEPPIEANCFRAP